MFSLTERMAKDNTVINRQIRLTPVLLIIGTALVMMGLSVLVGWHAQILTLIQIHPAFPVMQYNTAVAFVLCGLGVITTVSGRQPAAILFGILTALIGGLTMAEYIFGLDIGIDQLIVEDRFEAHYPGRMTPFSAACFLLSSVTIITLNIKQGLSSQSVVAGLLSSLIIAIGAGGIIGYLSGLQVAYGWGDSTRMALHTALGFLLIGLTLLQLSLKTTPDHHWYDLSWLATAIGIAVIVISIGLWKGLESTCDARLADTFRVESELIKTLVNTHLTDSIQALKRMGRRWENRGTLVRDEWLVDAQAYSRDFPAVVTMAWIDPQLKVRWVVPQTGNESFLGMDLNFSDQHQYDLEKTRDSRAVMITGQIDLA